MVDFSYVTCPRCSRRFMVHLEFFRVPDSYCHCPYCANEFPVAESPQTSVKGIEGGAPSPRGM